MDVSSRAKQEAIELHRPVRRKFPRRAVVVSGIDSVWCADLVDMQLYSKSNNGFKYILTVIDVLSRYAWARPLNNKNQNTVLDAFVDIITTSNRTPAQLWVDQGSEFLNKQFQRNFKTYHTYSEFKASPVERFNQTLKNKMWYGFTKRQKMEWVSRLPKLISKYNNTKHSSIKMTPTEASRPEMEPRLLEIQQDHADKIASQIGKAKTLEPGDKVRLAVTKGAFEKGYTPRWTEELFVVNHVNLLHNGVDKPVTYTLIDSKGEDIKGSFYAQELQKSDLPLK